MCVPLDVCPPWCLSLMTFVLLGVFPTLCLLRFVFVQLCLCPTWCFSHLMFVQHGVCPYLLVSLIVCLTNYFFNLNFDKLNVCFTWMFVPLDVCPTWYLSHLMFVSLNIFLTRLLLKSMFFWLIVFPLAVCPIKCLPYSRSHLMFVPLYFCPIWFSSDKCFSHLMFIPIDVHPTWRLFQCLNLQKVAQIWTYTILHNETLTNLNLHHFT